MTEGGTPLMLHSASLLRLTSRSSGRCYLMVAGRLQQIVQVPSSATGDGGALKLLDDAVYCLI